MGVYPPWPVLQFTESDWILPNLTETDRIWQKMTISDRPDPTESDTIKDVPDIRFRFWLAGYPAIFCYPVPVPDPAKILPVAG